MKKQLLFLVVLLAAVHTVLAQDTIFGRSPDYYYMDWYDECERFYLPYGAHIDRVCLIEMGSYDYVSYVGRYQHTNRPLLVKGLSAMVSIDYESYCNSRISGLAMGEDKLPEYMYLYQHDTVEDTLILLDSLRWDTVAPKIMMLPRNSDTSAGYLYCWSYEVMFKESMVINGSFFIAGSGYSNQFRWSNPLGFYHKPTMYVGIVGIGQAWGKCGNFSIDPNVCTKFQSDGPWLCIENNGYGPFHLIIETDSSILEVASSDDTMGTVTGGGIYYDSTTVYIRAVPYEGYRFTHWNDGDVTNPRAVYLTQDTLFTAYFQQRKVCQVDAVSNDEARGSVYGGGRYYEGDTVTLTAHPWGSYQFVRWTDGDTSNPRHVIVTQDTLFKAFFSNPQGIAQATGEPLFRLLPNPASGIVQCETAGDPFPGGTLTLTDATGRELMRHELAPLTASLRLDLSALPAGTYFVTLATPQGSSTQKLILE